MCEGEGVCNTNELGTGSALNQGETIMRSKQINVYRYHELSTKAKERARVWFLRGYPDSAWWEFTYEDVAEWAQELGIDLRQKAVKLMGGGTRYDPAIYFSGFYHQGGGSSFEGTWRADSMNLTKLKKSCLTDDELHRIGEVFAECAKEDAGLVAVITTKGDNWIGVDVTNGDEHAERLNALEYQSPEYTALAAQYRERKDTVTEALRDFNRWIHKRLEVEYEWLNAQEQVEEMIIANEYEFDEEGRIA
jgi:hypothetical protein